MNFIYIIITSFFLGSGIFDKTLPVANLVDIEGNDLEINAYTSNGKIQLVSLWATWCGPCRMELDALNKVYPEWKEKYDVEIVAITLDNKRAVGRAKKMFADKEWPFTFFHDAKGELSSKLGIRGIPYSMIIDGEGNIVSTSEGYYPGYEKDIEAKLEKLSK